MNVSVSLWRWGEKATTEAVSNTTGVDRQDAVTLNKCEARKKTPNIKHKKYFNL